MTHDLMIIKARDASASALVPAQQSILRFSALRSEDIPSKSCLAWLTCWVIALDFSEQICHGWKPWIRHLWVEKRLSVRPITWYPLNLVAARSNTIVGTMLLLMKWLRQFWEKYIIMSFCWSHTVASISMSNLWESFCCDLFYGSVVALVVSWAESYFCVLDRLYRSKNLAAIEIVLDNGRRRARYSSWQCRNSIPIIGRWLARPHSASAQRWRNHAGLSFGD